MTDSERQQILKMIADGKISAEQGLVLMRALDEQPEDDLETAELSDGSAPGFPEEISRVDVLPSFLRDDSGRTSGQSASSSASSPDFDRKIERFRKLWVIPLWLGVAVTVTGAYWMFSALKSSGMGFGFFFAWLPFLFGVALTALAFSSRTSRWIYVNIRQKPGESPQRIVLAFPLAMVRWIMAFTRRGNPEEARGAASDVMNALSQSMHSAEPLMVDVNEEDGEHVQVYIG